MLQFFNADPEALAVDGSVVCCNSRRGCVIFSRVASLVSTLIRGSPSV
jgi:hypothetical protein